MYLGHGVSVCEVGHGCVSVGQSCWLQCSAEHLLTSAIRVAEEQSLTTSGLFTGMSVYINVCLEDGLNLVRLISAPLGEGRLYFKHFEASHRPLQRLEQGSAPSHVPASLPVGIIATKPQPTAFSKMLGQAVPAQPRGWQMW